MADTVKPESNNFQGGDDVLIQPPKSIVESKSVSTDSSIQSAVHLSIADSNSECKSVSVDSLSNSVSEDFGTTEYYTYSRSSSEESLHTQLSPEPLIILFHGLGERSDSNESFV